MDPKLASGCCHRFAFFQEARPLLDSLEFDSRYEIVFRHVFGGTAIVRNMLAGNTLARTEGFDCVTFEGLFHQFFVTNDMFLFLRLSCLSGNEVVL